MGYRTIIGSYVMMRAMGVMLIAARVVIAGMGRVTLIIRAVGYQWEIRAIPNRGRKVTMMINEITNGIVVVDGVRKGLC